MTKAELEARLAEPEAEKAAREVSSTPISSTDDDEFELLQEEVRPLSPKIKYLHVEEFRGFLKARACLEGKAKTKTVYDLIGSRENFTEGQYLSPKGFEILVKRNGYLAVRKRG